MTWLPHLTAGDVTWFGGTQRALPITLASPKESGLRSNWAFTDHDAQLWDFNLGTDVTIWQLAGTSVWQSVNGRFGVTTRFQFNSESFDLWGADIRGGALWGLRKDKMAYEVYLFHESAHLGDEVIEQQERQRIDYNVNGIRVMVSRQWNEYLRLYGGVTGQPFADPEQLQSFGFHAGVEVTSLPPWRRGYVALDTEWWEWRDWEADATAQIGLFIGPRGKAAAITNARIYVELRSGRIVLGQYYNETEKYVAGGITTHW